MSMFEEKVETKGTFLSAEELVQQGWQRDMSMPIRGVKEYAPDGSWMDDKVIQVTFRERKNIIEEERVAKLGSLAVGEWKPDVRKVQLVKNKKKFWQTMGQVEDGISFLYPEEALYLLDVAMMEIYYGGVPLSVQQAYATLLDSETTLEQYQVYAFLSRYGYILRRFDRNRVLTPYERQLRLDQYTKATLKKKRHRAQNNSKNIRGSKSEIDEEKIKFPRIDNNDNKDNNDRLFESESSKSTEDIHGKGNCMEILQIGGSPKSMLVEDEVNERLTPPLLSGKGDNIPVVTTTKLSQGSESEPKPFSSIPYSKWDWTNVLFPNVANKPSITIKRPKVELLPCCVLYRKESYTFDMDSFCQHQRTEKAWEFSLGGTSWKRNIQAKNWGEYRVAYKKHVSEYRVETSPAGHLWKGDVVPLIKPEDARSAVSTLKKLQIVENVQLSLSQEKCKLQDDFCKSNGKYYIKFDVYLPNSKFKKTAELFPHHHLCIAKSSDPLPSLGESLVLSRSGLPQVPVHFAVVDGGDINFYVFHDVTLPMQSL